MRSITTGYRSADVLSRLTNISARLLSLDDIFRAPDGFVLSSWDVASVVKHFLLNADEKSTRECADEVIRQAWFLEIDRPEPRIDEEVQGEDWWMYFFRQGFVTVKYRRRIYSLIGRALLLYREFEKLGTDPAIIDLKASIEHVLGMQASEFLRITFAIFTTHLHNKGFVKMEHLTGVKDPRMQQILEPRKLVRALDLLCITPDSFRQEASGTAPYGLEAYLLNPLFTHPIIREEQGDRLFIPVTSLLIQRSTNGLYHMILDSLRPTGEKATQQFREAFGKHVFEPYVALHLTETIPKEWQRRGFTYTDPSRPSRQLGEVDVIGWDDGGVVFVETTLATAARTVQLAESRDAVMGYIRKLAAKVTQLQTHHLHARQLKSAIDPRLAALPHHCILVTYEQLPLPNLLIRYLIEKEIGPSLSPDFRYHIATMEDWEHLCSSAKKYEVPLTTLLREKEGSPPPGFDLMTRDCTLNALMSKVELNMPAEEKRGAKRDIGKWDLTDTVYSDFTDYLLRRFGKEAIGSTLLDQTHRRIWEELGVDMSDVGKGRPDSLKQ